MALLQCPSLGASATRNSHPLTVRLVECCTFAVGNFPRAVSVRVGVLPWDNVARGLAARASTCAVERRAREQALKYQAWASRVVDECLDDLTRDVTERIAHFGASTRHALRVETVHPSRRSAEGPQGTARVLCLQLGLDEVHIHGQWQPGSAPTVHLLWSRRRQNRYCQMVPLSGGRLMPLPHAFTDQEGDSADARVGYRIVAGDGSSDELSREQLLFRALGLLARNAPA